MAQNRDFDIRSFGAVGDGKTDCTAAIQQAIDAAAPTQATVYVPPGVYLSSTLRMHPHVGLAGEPTWTFARFGGSIIRLADEGARCLIDISESIGNTLSGLCLDGAHLGKGIHGVMLDRPDDNHATEHTPRIERCKVGYFSGDGVHFNNVWCFSVRHSMLYENGGDGLWLHGCDGFILDNWFSGNARAGFGAYEHNAAVTMTGNRIEWNHAGGIVGLGSSNYNVTGNYVDRSGGPGIHFGPRGDVPPSMISATGNVIWRSGRPDWCPKEEYASCHARLEQVRGLTFTANAFNAAKDDRGKGEYSPDYGIVYGGLTNSVIKDNVLHNAALKQAIVDLGGHGEGVIVKDNPSSVFVPGKTPETLRY